MRECWVFEAEKRPAFDVVLDAIERVAREEGMRRRRARPQVMLRRWVLMRASFLSAGETRVLCFEK